MTYALAPATMLLADDDVGVAQLIPSRRRTVGGFLTGALVIGTMVLTVAPANATEATSAGATTIGATSTLMASSGRCRVLAGEGYTCETFGTENTCKEHRAEHHPDGSTNCVKDTYKQGGLWYYGWR